MKISVKRLNLTGDIQAFSFNDYCGKYLVKNFSDADIYVSFEEFFTEEKAIKIRSNYGQVVVGNENIHKQGQYESKVIYIKGTGEVEVQQLWF